MDSRRVRGQFDVQEFKNKVGQQSVSSMQKKGAVSPRLPRMRVFRLSQAHPGTRQKPEAFHVHGPDLWTDPLQPMPRLHL
jgi:hypothetical protein